MISAKDIDIIRVDEPAGEEQQNDPETALPSIHVVPEEEEARLPRPASHLERSFFLVEVLRYLKDLQQVSMLSVDVAADVDGHLIDPKQ